MWTWILSLASVTVVSLVSLVGLVAAAHDPVRLRRIAAALVSFAVGALLGDAFIHLIPESFATDADALPVSLLVLTGMLLFFVIEKLLRRGSSGHGVPALAAINLIGDAAHNFVDGAMIGASYLVSPTLGVSTTLAVVLHELPQELGDFGVMLHSGLTVRRATRLNLATASVAVAGTVVVLLIGTVAGNLVVTAPLPIAAGGFVYLASADLIPELHRDRTLRGLFVQVALIAAGVGVMALLTLG